MARRKVKEWLSDKGFRVETKSGVVEVNSIFIIKNLKVKDSFKNMSKIVRLWISVNERHPLIN